MGKSEDLQKQAAEFLKRQHEEAVKKGAASTTVKEGASVATSVAPPAATEPAEPPEMIALVGPPGSGKTHTALSILEVPGVERAVALDIDHKMARMDAARPYIDSGRLKIITIRSPLIPIGSMEKRAGTSQEIKSGRGGNGFFTIAAPSAEPKGYLEIMHALDDADRLVAEFRPQAWITDSTTRVYEHMHRLISYMTKKGTLEESAWNIALMNGEEFVNAHMKFLPPIQYVIMTAHTRKVFDEKSGVSTGVEMEIQGSMRSKFLGYFGEAYYMDPTASEYRMWTKLSSFTPSRTAKRLNRLEPANLRVIFDKEFRELWYKSNKQLS